MKTKASAQRMRAKHLTLRDQYTAGKQRPPTRAQAKAWLSPIRQALRQIKTGEIDELRGYAVTKIKSTDSDMVRVDYVIDGFTGMMDRLDPSFDTGQLKRLARKLEAGILLTVAEVDACFVATNRIEDHLLGFSWSQLKSVVSTEIIAIEFRRMGIAA